MTSAISPGPRAWLAWIIDHNPCFILSGLCMLFGCHLLNVALYTPAGDTFKLLSLLAVLNVYEILLVGLGLILIRRPVFVRDGRILLGLEAMFLCDVTFTSGIIATVDPRWGFGVAAALLLLAGVKLALILTMIRTPEAFRTWLLILVQLVAVLGLAGVFKIIANPRHGRLPEIVVYAAWWLAAALPALGAALRAIPSRRSVMPSAESGLVRLFLVLPYVSLLVHLYSGGWVYDLPMRGVYLAPVLLGLALGAPAVVPRLLDRRSLPVAQLTLALGALLVGASTAPAGLTITLHGFVLTPFRATLAGAGPVCIYAAWLNRSWLVAGLTLAGALGGLAWNNWAVIWAWATSCAHTAGAFASRIVPRTIGQWGVLAVVLAFVLLGVGAWLSFKRPAGGPERETEEPDEPVPDADPANQT